MGIDTLTSYQDRSTEYIRANINELTNLPNPQEGWWRRRDTELSNPKTPKELHERNLVVRRSLKEQGSFEYRTKPETTQAIQQEYERKWLLPCGHTGLSNHGSEGYGCGYDACSARHTRSVVEEAMQE